MRFKLDFTIDRSELNADYRRCILSFIKHSLANSVNGDLLERYYKDTNTKDFSWTMIVSKPQFTKEKIQFADNKFALVFSTDDSKQTGMYLMLAFLNQKNKRYPVEDGNYFTLKNIVQLDQKTIKGTTARFVTMPGSSLVVREHNRETNRDTYYSCEDDGYQDKLEQALKTQAEMAGFSVSTVESIRLHSVSGRKVVVKHYGIYLDATIADFTVSGENKVLQYFYQNSACSRRSSGFGMLDIVEEG
ncbi:MAG: CRISPR-associated endoribonuclease Cas6 [Lachnospiraceae bacterium]|nr:CRISPR-associated endoribonuclease Cas6 [Lachnospiraceae bacterium]